MDKLRQIDYDIVYIHMAENMSSLSHAIRSKVGCVIVSEDGQMISQGFNGMPKGFSNVCENVIDSFGNIVYITPSNVSDSLKIEHIKQTLLDNPTYSLVTRPEVLHAETNAITKCAKLMASTMNATIYVTLSPCFECSKFIIQAGIHRVVFLELYHNTDGLDLLSQAGIIVQQIDIKNKKLIDYGNITKK